MSDSILQQAYRALVRGDDSAAGRLNALAEIAQFFGVTALFIFLGTLAAVAFA